MMLLTNVKLLNDSFVQIRIANGIIHAVTEQKNNSTYQTDGVQIKLEDAIAFPGLINSHDHLDFNLFPQYGNKIFRNYTQWAEYIHKEYKEDIQSVLKIPEALRVQWGIYKNLLCGVTTVVNHGKFLNISDQLINIIQPSENLHSVQFEKNWKLKLNNPFRNNQHYCIHIGEGTDRFSHKEINELINWNILNKEIIGIHAVAMNKKQSTRFKAIVWCPDSNHFLLETTANIKELKQNTSVLFGTDSTLTADWNIWNHLRLARSTQMANDEEILAMLTETASHIWRTNSGKIKKGKDADIVIAKAPKDIRAMETFYQLNPEDILLVMKKGAIKLFDEELKKQLYDAGFDVTGFSKIKLYDRIKYVKGDLQHLTDNIKQYYPEAAFPFIPCKPI